MPAYREPPTELLDNIAVQPDRDPAFGEAFTIVPGEEPWTWQPDGPEAGAEG